MPGGCGYGGFGTGPFGAYDWATEVLWDDVPEQPDRVYDADPALGNGALFGFQSAQMSVFRMLLNKLRDVPSLRDPDAVSTRFQDVVPVEILSSSIEVTGRTVRVVVAGPGPAVDPLDPLGGVSVGWVLTDRDGRDFVVDRVDKLTLSFVVVGNSFPTTTTVPGVPDAVLRAPAMVEHLSNDYGVDSDDHDPEAYQRAAVRDAWQWYRRKGADEGYQIVGDVYGHDVLAERLWYVGAFPPAAIPAADLYEYPAGSGLYYTTVAPQRPLFDEVAADVVPVDVFCWDVDPVSGDTWGVVIGSTMQGMVIVSCIETPVGSGIWRVRVTGDLSPVACAGLAAPRWYATFPAGVTGRFYLEDTPVDIGGGDWTFDVVSIGGSPVGVVPGATANVDYWCVPQPSCQFCPASALKVTVTPSDVLTETGVIWEQMVQRMLNKVLRSIPIHVRLVLWHFTYPPIVTPFGVAGTHFITTVLP